MSVGEDYVVYVALVGPKVVGVFDTVDMAKERIAQLAEVTTREVEVVPAYNGDLICRQDGYICARLVKTIYY